jgi:hypothetical protein
MSQIKTKLSDRRAAKHAENIKRGREIIDRSPCTGGHWIGVRAGTDCPEPFLEMATARNGELLVLRDSVIIGTRGPDCCWITEEAGTAIFDNADRTGIELQYGATGPDGEPIPSGTLCANEVANAVFEKQQHRPTLN